MNKIILFSLFVLVAVSACPVAADPEPNSSIRRFAVFSGSNDGGKERIKLRYANSDASSVAKVFEDLGGLDIHDREILVEPDVEELQRVIEKFADRIKDSKAQNLRTEMVFYYSGHSDDKGLLLKNGRLPYKVLRESLAKIDSDVRMAILDSCESGAFFTRLKGGKKTSSFLVDASSQVKGQVFLTSSSKNEAAQESDQIGASYFTHYLVSALRGAADLTEDKKVTLNEAYLYAFQETLAQTEQSRSGAQHPAYDIQLSGAGDLVLTDLHNTNASLRLPKHQQGRFFIRDKDNNLIVELKKTNAQAIEIGLDAEDYKIVVHQDGKYSKGTISLKQNRHVEFDITMLVSFEPQSNVSKGGSNLNPNEHPMVKKYEFAPQVGFKISLLPNENYYRGGAIPDEPFVVKFDINALAGKTDAIRGVSAGPFTSWVDEYVDGVQISSGFAYSGGYHNGVQVSSANYIGGQIDNGVQVSGLINFTKRNAVNLVQVSGLSNIAVGNAEALVQVNGLNNVAFGGLIEGVQVSGISNVALKNIGEGAQIAGISNVLRNGINKGAQIAGIQNLNLGFIKKGAQVAGLSNILLGGMNKGTQVAGISNIVKGGLDQGSQVAGITNIVIGNLQGSQVSGIHNFTSGSVRGAQVGLLNIAVKNLRGAQVGLFNAAGNVRGLQLGLFNFSRSLKGIPIGLFSYAKDGRLNLNVWRDEFNFYNFGIKTGTHSIYNLVSIGRHEDKEIDESRLGWAIGWHKALSEMSYFELDLMFQALVQDDLCFSCVVEDRNYNPHFTLTRSLRGSVGSVLSRYFKVYAGISANYATRDAEKIEDYLNFMEGTLVQNKDKNNSYWLGLHMGMEI